MGLSSISACLFPLFYIDEDGRRKNIIEKIELAAEPLGPIDTLCCTAVHTPPAYSQVPGR